MRFDKQTIRDKVNEIRRKHEKVDDRIVDFLGKFDGIMTCLLYFREMLFFDNRRLGNYPTKSIKTYCNEKKHPYHCIETANMREICIPAYFEKSKEKIVHKKSPEIYVAEMKDIIITGGNSFLIGDNCCLYDLITTDTEKRYDLSFESLLHINGKRAIVAEHGKDEILDEIAEGICLVGVASYNYYHVTVEILSRLPYVDRIEEYRDKPLLVDSVLKEVPQYMELLNRINKYNHPIIYIENRKRIKVKKLIYPSYNSWMPINIRKHGMMKAEDFLLSKSAIWNIRENIQDKENLQERCEKKVFISRRNNKNKRLVNEERIIPIFQKYGFEIVYPEEMTFQEQIELYGKTKYFACTTGAALTNIIYTANNAHIICIIPQKFGFCLYSTIAHLLGQKCTFLDAKITSSSTTLSKDDFILEESYCERFLNQL